MKELFDPTLHALASGAGTVLQMLTALNEYWECRQKWSDKVCEEHVYFLFEMKAKEAEER